VLVASGVLNFAYFFPIVHAAYFGGSAGPVQYDDNGPAMTAPLAITAIAAIVLGVFPDTAFSLYRLAWMAAAGVTGAGAGATP
jgi:multicomponent Na+:H+ antiporter subunit D